MKKIKYISLLFVLITLQGCEEQSIDVDRFGSLSGKVVDGDTYEPLEGVLIATNPASTAVITDESGEFILERVKIGDLNITARKRDFLTGNINVAIFENQNTFTNFFLLKDESNFGNVIIFDPVPGNGAVNQLTSFTFSWNVEQQNRGQDFVYTVFIFESNSTVQTIVGENLSVTEVVVSNLKRNTTYFWYVLAKFEGRNVANSPTWSFRTGNQ